MKKRTSNKAKYIYLIAGVVLLLGLIVAAIIVTKQRHNTSTKPNQTSQVRNADSSTTVPTDNAGLADVLDDEAASIDTDVKNYENSDYDDSKLNDNSLYN